MYLANLDKRLEALNPVNTLKHKREVLEGDVMRLNMLINQILTMKKHRFELLKRELDSKNPLSIMERGYSISESEGKIVTSINDVKKDSIMETKLIDGSIISKVLEVKENGK